MRTEHPHCVILTGDFNCRSFIWWTGDVEQPEGSALVELIEINSLYQLIEEPTNIHNEDNSCIDLIITDQPNFSSNMVLIHLWMNAVKIKLYLGNSIYP